MVGSAITDDITVEIFGGKTYAKPPKGVKMMSECCTRVTKLMSVVTLRNNHLTPTSHSHAKSRSIQNVHVHKRSSWFSIRGVKNAHIH